ncbi:helix-turn-helix domain-containing protein [Streptomyces sp. NPDC004111]|uniref:helix-turn-helix domain-containing protein n=1 Tax=Streptomyces sp. NPDC004111 TaxID=3364690 RepID=UPI0036B8D49C
MSAVPDLPESPQEGASVVPLRQDGQAAVWIMVGEQLRRWRQSRGLGLKDVAPVIRGSVSKISRLERGESPPKDRDVLDIARHYGVSPQEMREIENLLMQAHREQWYEHYADVTPNYLKRLIALEGIAVDLRTYENRVVPGLLQTEDYARAVVKASMPNATSEKIDRIVRLRMARQLILNQDMPRVTALLDEAVLLRPCGDSEAMCRQMQHLVDLSEEEKVNIRIVEFVRGASLSPPYPLTHLRFQDDGPAELAYVEHVTGATYITRRTELDEYRNILDELMGAVATAEDSRVLLKKAVGRYS